MKRYVLWAFALVVPVVCAANPIPPEETFDLDVGSGTNCIWPAVNETFTVTVIMENLEFADCYDEPHVYEGISGVAFMFERTFAGFKLSQTNLLPGLDFGDVEVDGWCLTAGLDCVEPDADGRIAVAEVEYLYLGTPGIIDIWPHPVDLNAVANCENENCFWEMPNPPGGVLGVGMEPPRGCGTSPVSHISWGSIKALFR